MLKTLVLAVTLVAVCRSCTFDSTCKSTYIYEASNADACGAANTYTTCVNTMTASCTAAQKAADPFKTAIEESADYVTNNCNSGPPPPPPPPGASSCYSATCESTYIANVAQGDACAVAEAYVNCVGQMKAACGATIPAEVTSTEQAAQAAQTDKCSGPPAPPAPPSTSCYSATCESTYITNVAQGDACAAAEAYVNCVGQMKAACGATIPAEVTSTEQAAQAAQTEKCSGPPGPPPPPSSSCSHCDSFPASIQNLMTQGVPTQVHCPVRIDYLLCLHNCNAQQSVIQSIAAENAFFCGNYIKENCTILYMHCNIGLPVLHQQNPTSVCDFWYICAAQDFNLCGERLDYNYSAVCDPLQPPVPPPQPTNGSPQPPQPTDGSSPPPVPPPQPTDGSSQSPQQPAAQPSINNDKNRTPTLGPATVVMISAFLAAILCSIH